VSGRDGKRGGAEASPAWPANLGGFRFLAGPCGIKEAAADLAWIIAEPAARCAAVFTTNRLQAAPVRLSRENLRRGGGRVRALVVNSGNANCATGAAGRRAAQATARSAAQLLACGREEILVASTGVIGVPLPWKRITAQLERWSRRADEDGAAAAAQAICTTDTRPKLAGASFRFGGRVYHVGGFAKGAGMIHPRMATMLGFLFTDAPLALPLLRRCLRQALAVSFHRITVDGDTSTNDMVALLAAAGKPLAPAAAAVFTPALAAVAASLARQIVCDGEGARRFVTITVEGARTAAEADRAARAIAHSPLVKTALAGADPNWGRILAAAGYSGARFDPERAEVQANGMVLYRRGRALPFDEGEAKRRLDVKEVEVRVRLGAGRARAWMWTCDLTEAYIHINASYRT